MTTEPSLNANADNPDTDEIVQGAPGQPWVCLDCGETRWIAHYTLPTTQGVTLLVGPHNELDAADYNGVEETSDADPDEYYECRDCGAMIYPDGTRFE